MLETVAREVLLVAAELQADARHVGELERRADRKSEEMRVLDSNRIPASTSI
jgi:hypothetical protein